MIVKVFYDREKVFVIWSNDFDFCVFDKCRFILDDLFDMYNGFQMGLFIEVSVKFEVVWCGVILSEKVRYTLGVGNQWFWQDFYIFIVFLKLLVKYIMFFKLNFYLNYFIIMIEVCNIYVFV